MPQKAKPLPASKRRISQPAQKRGKLTFLRGKVTTEQYDDVISRRFEKLK